MKNILKRFRRPGALTYAWGWGPNGWEHYTHVHARWSWRRLCWEYPSVLIPLPTATVTRAGSDLCWQVDADGPASEYLQ